MPWAGTPPQSPWRCRWPGTSIGWKPFLPCTPCRMRILLVGDYPGDPRLGSTKVFVKLQEEFRALGHTCDVLLADDLVAAPRNRYARQLLGPMAAAVAVRRAFRAS